MLSIFKEHNKENVCKKELLQYSKITFELVSDNIEMYNLFVDMLKPHCEKVEHTKEEDFSFNLVQNKSIFNEVQEYVNMRSESNNYVISYCSKESGTMRVKCFSDLDFNIYQTTKTESFLITDSENKNFYFVTHPSYLNKPALKKDGYLFLEHILHKYMNLQGSILLHASAVSGPNGVILFIGPKRSGKTTLFFEATKKLGMSPVSVDKVHLYLDDDGKIRVEGFPTRLRVLAGTLNKYGTYFNSLIPSKYQNASSEELWKGTSDSKVDITIPQFEKFIENTFKLSDHLNMIIFPNLDKDIVRGYYEKNDRDMLDHFLSPNIYTPNNPEEDWWSNIGIEKKDILERNRKNIYTHILYHIPSYALYASENVYKPLSSIITEYYK